MWASIEKDLDNVVVRHVWNKSAYFWQWADSITATFLLIAGVWGTLRLKQADQVRIEYVVEQEAKVSASTPAVRRVASNERFK